jgi:hypothetical protein
MDFLRLKYQKDREGKTKKEAKLTSFLLVSTNGACFQGP